MQSPGSDPVFCQNRILIPVLGDTEWAPRTPEPTGEEINPHNFSLDNDAQKTDNYNINRSPFLSLVHPISAHLTLNKLSVYFYLKLTVEVYQPVFHQVQVNETN